MKDFMKFFLAFAKSVVCFANLFVFGTFTSAMGGGNSNRAANPPIPQCDIDSMAKDIKSREGQNFLTEITSIIKSVGLEKYIGELYTILLCEIDICRRIVKLNDMFARQTRLYAILFKYVIRINYGERKTLVLPQISNQLTSRVNKVLHREAAPMKEWFAEFLANVDMTEYTDFVNILLLNDAQTMRQLENPKNFENPYIANNFLTPEFVNTVKLVKGIEASTDDMLKVFQKDMLLHRLGNI